MQHTGDKPIFSQFYRIEYVIYSIAIYKRETKTVVLFSGWHHRLNVKAGMAGLGVYRLLPLLRREAQLVDLNVTAADLERDTSTLTTELELRLQDAWDSYMDEALTTSKFLRTVAHLYGPKDDGM